MSAAVDSYLAQLASLTHMSVSEWNDFLSLSSAEQEAVAQTYRELDWTKSPDTMATVLNILGLIGTIGGDIANAASAAGAIKALLP